MTESSPFPVIETVPLGEHLPKSERIVYKRNPLIDGIIDFTGGTAGKNKELLNTDHMKCRDVYNYY